MKIPVRRVLDDVLVADTRCIGAAFCSYTFDPSYFEEHVLRSLLRLSGDPDEDAARFHEEAREALRETPVACFVDASVRRGGRRLPYDLHLIRRRTFHPKVILILYPDEARLAVGSGNLTRSGLELNTELFFSRRLRYDDPIDATMLRAVDAFLRECADLAPGAGTQLAHLQTELRVRLARTGAAAPDSPISARFVHTFSHAVVRCLDEAIPRDATIERIGILAPFFERDDLDVADERAGMASIIAQLVALRPGARPALDVAVPWENAPLVRPTGASVPMLASGPDLWAWRWNDVIDGEEVERIRYLAIDRVGPKQLDLVDGTGRSKRSRVDAETAITDGALWRVERPTVHAPARILHRLEAETSLALWLHPTNALDDDARPTSRPLHAKLFLITTVHRGTTSTYALVGSANASYAALATSVASGGNVEAGILFRLAGAVRLSDFLSSLVATTLDAVDLVEREPPIKDLDLSAWIDDAVHHADARTLTITWAAAGPAPLAAWGVRYVDHIIARGDGPGSSPTLITDFELSASSAEFTFECDGCAWTVPIRVADLGLLPTRPGLVSLDLRALLALLGRRIGGERLATVRTQRGPTGLSAILDALLGEGVGPTDIFRAWWGLSADLATAPTLASFRNHLHGSTGVMTVWGLLSAAPPEHLARAELWIYGCELVRELERMELPPGPDRELRRALLVDVIQSIRDDLRTLEPARGGHAWVDAVHQFYGTSEDV